MTVPMIVGIGASGGEGLRDIAALLEKLPRQLPAIVLVVLHRPADRISHLQEVLSQRAQMPVAIAADRTRFEAGTCYIGEPAEHLTLAANTFPHMIHAQDNEYRNRTVDLLFTSIASQARGRMIGVILSGALDDGARGLAAIKAAGGTTMVMVREGSDPKGMPRSAIAYDGPIDVLDTPEAIAHAITARVMNLAG